MPLRKRRGPCHSIELANIGRAVAVVRHDTDRVTVERDHPFRLCQRMAASFGERGARIVSVSPGLILDTPPGEQELARQPAMRAMLDLTPLRRGGRAEDIAAVVEWLCFSPDAAFITGTDLRIDGGVTAALQCGTPGPTPNTL